MELDDLRRHWQQAPPPSGTPLARLDGLLSHAPTSLVDRMRRNTWYEILATPLFLLLPLLVTPSNLSRNAYLGVMLLLVSVMSYYYVRQLRLLRQMSQPDASIRGHLQVLCQGLRQLLRLYYRLTMWMVPIAMALVLGATAQSELPHPGGPRWGLLALLGSLSVAIGMLVQLSIRRFTRQYLQRLYGQHLDRLEGQLRELDDSSPPMPG